MHVYHCLDIKQPDAVPSYGRSLAVGNPVEFIEDMCQVFFFYSDAVVGNADDDRTVALFCRYLDVRTITGIFDGIVQNVAQDVVKMCSVGFQYNPVRHGFQPDMKGFGGFDALLFDDFIEQPVQLYSFVFKFEILFTFQAE